MCGQVREVREMGRQLRKVRKKKNPGDLLTETDDYFKQ